MLIEENFSALLAATYEGPLEHQPWRSLLALLREQLDADVAVLFLQPPSPNRPLVMLVDGGVSEGIASYEKGLFSLDPFVDLPAGKVVSLREIVPEQELLASEFYRLSLQPSKLHDFLGADIVAPGEFEARFRLSRNVDRPLFGEAEKVICQALLPHLERAIRLHTSLKRIESERALYAGTVEQLALGTIILDEHGRILDKNDTANELLSRKDGLRVFDGKLQLASSTANAEFQAQLAQVLENLHSAQPAMVEALSVPRTSGAADLGLIIRAIPAHRWSEGKSFPSVAILVSDPERDPATNSKTLVRLFGFTPTEASLSLHLANGLSLDEAAEKMGVSRNTVRTHLRSVFSKTGVSRQTLLVSLILKSVAPLAAGQVEPALADS